MKGIVINPPGRVDEANNFRLITGMLDELYFRRAYHSGTGSYAAGAATNSNSRGAVVDFPKAGNPAWRITEERSDRWRRAGVLWRVRYTTNAAGGGNFRVRFQLGCYAAGDNLATIGMYQSDKTIAAPAANSDVSEAEFVDTTSTIIPGNKPGIAMLLLRISGDAADTSANVLQVLALTVKVLPQG